MKKLMLIVLLAVLLPAALHAQLDTVQWKYRNYHYSPWYDTLPEFFDTSNVHYYADEYGPVLVLGPTSSEASFNRIRVMPQHVDRPTFVLGAAVAVPTDTLVASVTRYLWHLPEYVYLFQKMKDSIVLCDSARWDSITPKVMKIALNADTARWGFGHAYVYEAMFSNPVSVDSTFYLVSSDNGRYAPGAGTYYAYQYLPVVTATINYLLSGGAGVSWCPMPPWYRPMIWDPRTGEWSPYDWVQTSPSFGSYFPIVDYVDLIVTAADTAMGTAGPVALVSRNSTQIITATPKRGYEFSHWQDGDTGMMRYVVVSQDTECYTAYFTAKEPYHVVGLSNDEMMGYVTVDDTVYYQGDTATVEAFVRDVRYKFVGWENGNTEARRKILVNGDTSVTAYFAVRPEYKVDVQANCGTLGTVAGGGRYYEGDEAVIEAVARHDGRFLYWDDLVRDNPRTLVVTQDTHFVAVFIQNHDNGVGEVTPDGSMFLMVPNPASDEVRCVMGGAGFAGGTLSVTDAAGRTVLRRELKASERVCEFRVADLPAGTYFVTLTTKEGTSTRKLVVE